MAQPFCYVRRAGGTFEPLKRIADRNPIVKALGRDFCSMNLFDRIICQAMRLGARALAVRHVEMAATGLAHIPTDGPVLLVGRHYHHLFDGVVLLRF